MAIKGLKNHQARLRALRQVDAQAGLVRAAKRIEETAKASIVSGGGFPSAPGQTPHNQTGALVAGIYSGPSGKTGAHITSSDPASATLEFSSSSREARPFLRPAVDKNLKAIRDEVKEQVRISLRIK